MDNKAKLTQTKALRSVWSSKTDQWYFAVVDVISILTDCKDPAEFLKKLRRQDRALATYLDINCPKVDFILYPGKTESVFVASNRQLFRILQSLSSPQAESFKLWLAQIAFERIEEILSPHLSAQRIEEIEQCKLSLEKRLTAKIIDLNAKAEQEEPTTAVFDKETELKIFTEQIDLAITQALPKDAKSAKIAAAKKIFVKEPPKELIAAMLGEVSAAPN